MIEPTWRERPNRRERTDPGTFHGEKGGVPAFRFLRPVRAARAGRWPRSVALALAAIIGVWTIPGCHTVNTALRAAHVPCGVYRWRVKTLTDRDSAHVRWKPIRTTVRALVSLPRPADIEKSQRTGHEFYVYRIRAILTRVHRNVDQDLHLALCDPSDCGIHMIAEVPNPSCMGDSGHARAVAAAREAARSLRGSIPVLVEVVGVGFFDDFHDPTGGAPNRFELHPVLSLRPVEPQTEGSRTRNR